MVSSSMTLEIVICFPYGEAVLTETSSVVTIGMRSDT